MDNEKMLWNLRKEIVLNSLYASDYENSFGIDKKIVQSFFEEYENYLQYLMHENNLSDNDYFDYLDKYDNPSNLNDFFTCDCSEYVSGIVEKGLIDHALNESQKNYDNLFSFVQFMIKKGIKSIECYTESSEYAFGNFDNEGNYSQTDSNILDDENEYKTLFCFNLFNTDYYFILDRIENNIVFYTERYGKTSDTIDYNQIIFDGKKLILKGENILTF